MKKNNLIIIIVIILALLGFILYPWVILPIKNASQNVIKPISLTLNECSNFIGNFFSKVGSIGNLDEENNKLKQENLELKSQ